MIAKNIISTEQFEIHKAHVTQSNILINDLTGFQAKTPLNLFRKTNDYINTTPSPPRTQYSQISNLFLPYGSSVLQHSNVKL